MNDTVIRASAYNDTVRAFAADIRNTLNTAIGCHDLNPIAATALGRALAAASMMREMGKSDTETVTIKIKGEGPMAGLVAVASKGGMLKGYVSNNDYSTYGENASDGVGACIGKGFLSIIKDFGIKTPYSGTIPLQSGEIGDDLAYYFSYSEQIPSLVALGVKLNPDATAETAVGMIIQLMPGAQEDTITKIENRLKSTDSASKLFEKVKTTEKMLEFMLKDGNPTITETKKAAYNCDCSRDSMLQGVISLGREELDKIVKEQDVVETLCHYCLTKYHFSNEEIRNIIEK